jgi:hypothetical protein
MSGKGEVLGEDVSEERGTRGRCQRRESARGRYQEREMC